MNLRVTFRCFFIVSFFFTASLAAQVQKAYAGEDNILNVIDYDSMVIIKTIPGANAYRMVLTPDGKKLYTTDHNNQIHVIDTEADTLLKTFDPSTGDITTNELEGIAISPDGQRVYISDESNDNLFVIDTATDSVIAAVALDLYEAEDMIVSPDGKWLYLNDNDDVVKISTDSLKIVAKTFVSNDGHGIALNMDGTKIYAHGEFNGTGGVVVIDSDSMVIKSVIDAGGYHLESSIDGTRIFGVNESRRFTVIDALADTLLYEINFVSGSFRGIAETPDQKYILLASSTGLIKIDAFTGSVLDTANGAYRATVVKSLPPTSIKQQKPNLSLKSFILNQNYPNPFNPSTVISYRLDNNAPVQLTIYDLGGRKIKTLVNHYQAAGGHTVLFNATDLASGVYIYKLKVGSFAQNRKMILLR